MVILKTQSVFGHAPPPQTPYSIVSNLPGWDLIRQVRDGDMSGLAGMVHVYPRFAPTQFAAQLSMEITKKLGIEGKGCMFYLNPIMMKYTGDHVTRDHRKEHIMKREDLMWRVVDVAGHRLYCVFYDPRQTPGIILSWGQPGLGISIRGAESLLKGIEGLTEVPMEDLTNPPKPTFTPEGWAHAGLRERINELVHRAAIDPAKATCKPEDIFLYPSGMAAVYKTTNLLLEHRPGTAVVLGVVFHNTHHHLLEESPNGFKHIGKVDKESIDNMEVWLEEEKDAGRPVSFAIVEFPGNPTLDTPDLPRLKKLAEKYNFVLIVDDTIGSFANIDVFPYSDILLTSLTKSFSGYADVLGGSIVLNPLSPSYPLLAPTFISTHTNELFASDARTLLTNSADLLARTRILNRNAAALATFLHKQSLLPNSIITDIQYPTLLPSFPLYTAHLRRPTSDLPEPGYGCLLTINFVSTAKASKFYNRCGFYPSPHLGAHVTIMLPYGMMLGKEVEEAKHFRELGVKEESVRISVGLEKVEDLIDTVWDALEFAKGEDAVVENGHAGKK